MIKCRTRDGLELDLEVSLQYRVDPNEIFKIYTSYGTQEKAILTRVVLDVISDTATLYSSNDFFTKRSAIQKKMLEDLQSKVLALTWHRVEFFQLRSIKLPTAYENEIENTEVKGQDILKAQAEQQREFVKFNTSIAVETLRVNATLEEATGNAQKIIYEGLSYQNTIGEVTTAQADSIVSMKQNLGFANSDLIEYLRSNLLRDYQSGRIAMHLDL